MVYSVKCLANINTGCKDTERLFQIKCWVYKIKQLNQIMCDRESLQPTLARIQVGLDYWQQPAAHKWFIDFTQKGSLCNVSEVVFTFRWNHLRNWYLVFYLPCCRKICSPYNLIEYNRRRNGQDKQRQLLAETGVPMITGKKSWRNISSANIARVK